MNRISKIGIILALSADYAAAYIATFFWKWPDPDLALGILVGVFFIASVLFGGIMIDVTRTMVYTFVSALLGSLIAISIIVTPSVLAGQNLELVDASLTVAVTAVSRFFIVGITFILIGALIGSFIGDATAKLQ